MFFQPRPSCSYGSHPGWRGSHGTAWRSRQQELDEREQSLLEARERLARWAEQLKEREYFIEERQAELDERERAHENACMALKKRVEVLDAADRAQAQASKAALETAAAVVLQRAARRKLAKNRAARVVAGFRALRGLEKRYQTAMVEYEARGNRPLLDNEITKILEAADGISTRDSEELRSQRKAFVRRVMSAAGDEGSDSDTSSDTSLSHSGWPPKKYDDEEMTTE